ncbi:aspartyl protease family protein [Phaeodactylibacter xiamenensis]|uniref:aspartyl protease family protein n=1 Tax=Phaeodactylibacter xiamenensis TaxID=1524460 RepID=UPI003CCC1EF0
MLWEKIYATIRLINTRDVVLADAKAMDKAAIRSLELSILVDSGAYNLAINETIKEQLGLPVIDEQVFELANGQQEKYPIVAPLISNLKTGRQPPAPFCCLGTMNPYWAKSPARILM